MKSMIIKSMIIVIIILNILLIASVAGGDEGSLPFRFECHVQEDNERESELCSAIWDAAKANDGINLEYDPDMPYFHLVILPVARDGYTSVAVASSFIYPPLDGLSLSAYLGGFLIVKGKPYDKSSKEIVRRMLATTKEWMTWAADIVVGLQVRPAERRLRQAGKPDDSSELEILTLEASNE